MRWRESWQRFFPVCLTARNAEAQTSFLPLFFCAAPSDVVVALPSSTRSSFAPQNGLYPSPLNALLHLTGWFADGWLSNIVGREALFRVHSEHLPSIHSEGFLRLFHETQCFLEKMAADEQKC